MSGLKIESSRLTMAILKIDHQIFNLKIGFHLIGSDKNLDIYINSETIDGKHALLEISSNGMKIFDLQSKYGTFINGNKIDCIKFIEIPKKCPIQFGNITGDIKILENDSGFSESLTNSKNTSDIIVSSPERNPETHTFYLHRKHKKTVTSTPNFDKQFKSLSPKQSNENSVDDKINQNKKNLFNIHNSSEKENQNDKSSFFVPETQPINFTNKSQNEKNVSNSDCHDSSKVDDQNNKSSFFVPETQPFTLIPENKGNDIFSNIVNDNIRKNIENMCENDEFYIPETQEIFEDNNKTQNLNSQCGMFKISTQDYNASAGVFGPLDISSDLSNDSENLFNGIQLSSNIPLIKSAELDINIRKSNLEKSTNAKSNMDEYDDDYDAEMSALNWNEFNQEDEKKFLPTDSNSVTPDFLLDKNKIIENNEKLEILREDSITPDIIVENNKSNNTKSSSVTPDLIIDSEFDANTRKEIEIFFKQECNQNVLNEHDLESTQLFTKSIKKNGNNKSIQKNNLLQSHDEDLEPTQIFTKHISLSNNSDKENTRNSIKGNAFNLDKSFDSTQIFVAPQRKSINNKKQLIVDDNDNSLEPTQPFFRKKINSTLPEKDINFTLESDGDENSPIKRTGNKLLDTSDEEEDLCNKNKFKTPISSGINKTCSTDYSNRIMNNSTSSTSNSSSSINKLYTKSNDINSQNSFDFITCTPKFDFIKPHQSNDIKQAGHLFNNVKSKNNKILLEESSDDDDSQCIDNLINLLDDKNDKNRNRAKNSKKSPNIETKTSTAKRSNYKNVPIQKDKTTDGIKNINSQDSTTSQIRKKQFCSDLEHNSIKRTSRKRTYKTDVGDDDEHMKLTTQQERKKSEKKLTGKETNDNNLCQNENGRGVKRRCTKKLKHKIVFTIVEASKYRSTIELMGGQIVDNPKDATILISTGILRTCKFMVALARGIPIVSYEWLDAIMNSPNISTSHNDFLINDPINEKKFKFSLRKTLELSATNSIFKNYTFLITPKTQPPPSELIQIINCTGGHYVKEIPKGSINISKFYVVSDKKDNKLWPKIRKSIPNVNIISTEGILLSVMQHSIRFSDHLLT